MTKSRSILDTMESLPNGDREHMLLWYSTISRNSFFAPKGKHKGLTGENLVQAAFSEYVGYKYPKVLYHHSPNEGDRKGFAKWLIELFTIRSIPDCMFYTPKFKENGIGSCGLAIELKYGSNKCSPKQEEVLEELAENGWSTYVCYDLSSAMTVLNNYMK